ncbi:MAG: TIGR04282 family arsenosugar biosynthesis glycosyltransferase [Trebonia sp.]
METQFTAGTLAVQVIVLVQPPVSLEDAPLRETLKAVLAAPVARRVLALGGAGEDWLPAGFDLMGQRGVDYGERMAAAVADAHATAALPMLLIRADALEISADILEDAARSLISAEADTAFGPASDGGFWLLGLRQPDWSLVAGLPAPGDGGGRQLLERLALAGLRVALAPRLEIAGAAIRF